MPSDTLITDLHALNELRGVIPATIAIPAAQRYRTYCEGK